MQADIKAHSGTNDISVLNSNIKGNIENLSSLNLRLSNTTFYGDIKNTNELELSSNTYINGSILTKTLKATDSIFTLDIDIAQQSTQSISSTQNSEGKNNTLRLNFTSFANENLQSLVLASLKDPSMQINEDFFKVEKISAAFSQYLPNLIFERKDDEAQWSLEKTNNSQSYFNQAPNTETINKSNALFNQVLLSYVIEWNNLQKRMGELRANPNSVGTWMRSFGGGNSDSIYKGTFFELQLGSDYRFEFAYGDLYLGTMLNYTQNDIKGDGLKANSKGYGLGAYASLLFTNEAYLDTVLRYVYKKHSVNASFIPDFQNSPLNDSSAAITFLLSIEAGHRLYLQSFFNYGFLKDFYVEPQLELIAGHLQGMQWQNETVSLELLSSNTLSIKPALFFGKRFFLKDRTTHSLNDSLSLRLGFAHNFDLLRYGDRILSDQSSSTRYKGLRDKRLSVSLGTDYILNGNFRLALEFERNFFGYLNIDYKANANLRFSF